MKEEYSIDGLGKVFDEVATEPDIALRNYRISDYATAAKDSWQYAADGEFRTLIDKLLANYAAHDEKMDKLYTIELEASIALDKAIEMTNALRDKMLLGLLPAYASGNREPQLLYYLRDLMESDIRRGRFDSANYGGLTLDDLGDAEEKR